MNWEKGVRGYYITNYLSLIFEKIRRQVKVYKMCHGCDIKEEEANIITELTCNDCPKLRELPFLPVLKKLTVRRCHFLTTINSLPLLVELEIRECELLSIIPELSRVRRIGIYKCDNLPMSIELPRALNVSFTFCQSLVTLIAPMANYISCTSCKALTKINRSFYLKYLDISFSSNIASLPDLPFLETLYCEYCQGLSWLPELPSLKKFVGNYCSKLKNLPPWPTLQEFDGTFIEDLTDMRPLSQNVLKRPLRYLHLKVILKWRRYIRSRRKKRQLAVLGLHLLRLGILDVLPLIASHY